MFRPALRRAVVSCFAVTFLALGSSAQDAESLFQDGVEAFRRGDNAAAAQALKAALAANPSDEQAFKLLDRVEEQTLMEMLVSRGELGSLSERFLGLARLGRRTILSDPGNAEEVVARLMTGDEQERVDALFELQGLYGEWAVPALVGPLGDLSGINNRVRAMQALIRLGDLAVVPLIEVLQSQDELTRINAASVLGALRDPRAGAALAWMANNDESPTARAMASEALDKLSTELDAVGLATRDPLALTLGLSQRWLVGDADIVKPYDAGLVAWSWDDGALQGEPVLGGLYALKLAEATLRNALANGAGEAAQALLAAVYAAQKGEILASTEVPALADNELLAAAEAGLEALDLKLALAGSQRGEALRLLLANGQTAAAEVLVAAMGRSPSETNALAAALQSGDPRVASAAALVLGQRDSTSDAVVNQLGLALAGVPDRMVLSLGETGLSAGSDGWQVLSSLSVAEGLMRAKSYPPKDVVVIQDGLQGVTLDTMVFGLTNDPRTADVPIIVVTDDVSAVSTLYGDKVAKVLAAASMADVLEVAGDPSAAQQRAMERAAAAAAVLAAMPAGAVQGVARQAAAALRSSATADVKRAVLDLAGRAGLVDSLDAVEALVSQADDRDLQLAALTAASQLWALNGGASDSAGDLRTALEAALASDDGELARAAAEALGQMGTSVSLLSR